MTKKINKNKQPDPNYLTINLTIVPQGEMVKPRSYIARIDRKSITSAIIQEIKDNPEIKQIIKGYL
jgi:hypothetical protein